MGAQHWEQPTEPFTARLDGRLAAADTTVSITNIEGLVAPGILVVERLDTSDIASAKKEFISYTGINGTSLTGLTRALAGTTAVSHDSGALVECFFSISHWNDLQTALLVEHSEDTGKIKMGSTLSTLQFTGVSGLSGLKGAVVFGAVGNFTLGSVSGYSTTPNLMLMDIGPYQGNIPQFVVGGGLVSGTIGATPINLLAENYELKYVSAILKSPASGASLVLDINKNGSSIFEAATVPIIAAGGTYVSTASINTKSLVSGDQLTLDIDKCNWGSDLVVSMGI